VQEASSGGTTDIVAMEFIPLQNNGFIVSIEFVTLNGTNKNIVLKFIPLHGINLRKV